MKTLILCLAMSLALVAGEAQAQSGVPTLYVGAGFTEGNANINGGGEESLGTVSTVLGLQFRDYLGVELAIGSGSDQTGSILSEPLVTYQAAMLKLGHRWDAAGVYILAGHALLNVDSRFNNTNAGNALGFGFNFFGNETTSLNFNVLDIDGGAFRTATIGFQYYFGGYKR